MFTASRPPPDQSSTTSTASRAIVVLVELVEAARQVELIPHEASWPAAQRIFRASSELKAIVAETWR